MAIVARFSFDVPFGKKSEALAILEEGAGIEAEVGFPKPRRMVGSIGTPESRIEEHFEFESLAALEATWAKLNNPKMAEFMKRLAPYVVPGSHRWEVLRIVGE
ncbi:MAG: hypothetical protein OEZ06_23005 [Myxococcales bacterium]|nr:hypothetical protein [Myxococcales bacterium]